MIKCISNIYSSIRLLPYVNTPFSGSQPIFCSLGNTEKHMGILIFGFTSHLPNCFCSKKVRAFLALREWRNVLHPKVKGKKVFWDPEHTVHIWMARQVLINCLSANLNVSPISYSGFPSEIPNRNPKPGIQITNPELESQNCGVPRDHKENRIKSISSGWGMAVKPFLKTLKRWGLPQPPELDFIFIIIEIFLSGSFCLVFKWNLGVRPFWGILYSNLLF